MEVRPEPTLQQIEKMVDYWWGQQEAAWGALQRAEIEFERWNGILVQHRETIEKLGRTGVLILSQDKLTEYFQNEHPDEQTK